MKVTINNQLKYLGLKNLAENWDLYLKQAQKRQTSYVKLLSDIVQKEYEIKIENARISRINKAKIPEMFVMETFPFTKQQKLKKKMVLQLYDSMQFLIESQDLIFIGPSGCGKTGLATSYLVHAINNGCKGRFICFSELIDELYRSCASHNQKRTLSKFKNYQVLLIDEIGYGVLDKDKAGLFFELMKLRHKKATTLLTSQLGFEDWGDVIRDKHLTAAILNRLTVNCIVFNLKNCMSIRPYNVVQATDN